MTTKHRSLGHAVPGSSQIRLFYDTRVIPQEAASTALGLGALKLNVRFFKLASEPSGFVIQKDAARRTVLANLARAVANAAIVKIAIDADTTIVIHNASRF